MTHVALMELAATLLAMASRFTGDPVPAWVPEIHLVPHTQIEYMTCQHPCRIRAGYFPDLGIFLDDDLDVQHDLYARSILLHELAHHVQEVTAKYQDLGECESGNAREDEAYALQNAFLRQQSEVPVRIYNQRHMTCPVSAKTGSSSRPY